MHNFFTRFETFNIYSKLFHQTEYKVVKYDEPMVHFGKNLESLGRKPTLQSPSMSETNPTMA